MKVGDLIRDKEFPEAIGIIIYKDQYGDVNAYGVLAAHGRFEYLSKDYIENGCEVLSESR
tara:strand:+ start:391 stop:570 length:180 start_codon:yes stop_codon:yes gene_type:complete